MRNRRIMEAGSSSTDLQPSEDDPDQGNNVLPVEWGGAYYSAKIREIFANWRRGDYRTDIPAEDLDFVVRYEFQAVEEPGRKKLLDSVLRTPEQELQTKRRFNPMTGKADAEWLYDPETGASYSDKGLYFEQGQYVEYQGLDMRWHLAPVRRVVRLIPEDWEPVNDDDKPPYHYFYNIGSEGQIDPKRVRAPEEGLKLIYGFRPWVWQQWAMLKIEQMTRFMENHEMDFRALNFHAEAQELWDLWLNDKRNRDFKDHVKRIERDFKGSTDKLVTHILSSFAFMDEVSKNKERWGLGENSDINIFMYVSVLGSGFATALVVVMIQLMVPILLLDSAVSNPADGHLRFNLNGQFNFSDENSTYHSDWELFCSGTGALTGRVMNITVLLLYTVRVVPDLLYSFFASSGQADEPKERVNELRRIIWDKGDDTMFMQFGYKLNKYANGLYVSLLMTIMLFILFLTEDIFSIILNALALEFVHNLDEELATGAWFDPGARWISGGATELVIRATLLLEYLLDWPTFCKEYDIPAEEYRKAFGDGKPRVLCDAKVAKKDNMNEAYMSKKARYYYQALNVAKKRDDDVEHRYHVNFRDIGSFSPNDATRNFKEEVQAFGVFDKLFVALGLSERGLFNRYKEFYVWSYWEKILYLSAVPVYDPTLDKFADSNWNQTTALASNNRRRARFTTRLNMFDSFKSVRSGRNDKPSKGASHSGSCLRNCCLWTVRLPCSMVNCIYQSIKSFFGFGEIKRKVASEYLNFSYTSDLSPVQRFLSGLRTTLLLGEMYTSIRVVWRRGEYYNIPFRVVDGIMDWISTFYQAIFPLLIVFFFYLAVACY